MKQKLTNNIIQIFCILSLTLLSGFILHQDHFVHYNYILTLGLALILARFSKILLIITLILQIIFALYAIVGYTYGSLNLSMITSLFDTNHDESIEFLHTLGWQGWFMSALYLGLSILYYKTCTILKPNKWLYILIIPAFIYAAFTSWPGSLIRHAARYSKIYLHAKQEIANSIHQADSWVVTPLPDARHYQNYVLVIGESVRQDYLSVYGYPHNTTPWLNTVNGTFISGTVSMGPNTPTSLSRTLQRTVGDGLNHILQDNIITLANKAGYDTYWISNQGRTGKYDLSTSAVGLRAKHTYFSKESYEDKNEDDLVMLDTLRNILRTPEHQPRLIILHMMGSHPYPCERLHGFPKHFSLTYSEGVNCYLASIEKTDDFLKKTTEILAKEGSYSLIYFADHGLNVNPQTIYHDSNYASSYAVPMFIISSDSNAHKVVHKHLSNRHFLSLFANWIGVRANHTDPAYNFDDPEHIPEDQNITAYSFNTGTMQPVSKLPYQKALQ